MRGQSRHQHYNDTTAPVTSAAPAVNGVPTVDAPQLLNWPKDANAGLPDLTEETANRLSDLHGQFSEDCDLVLSTAGNYHMALKEFWYDVFLPNYAPELKNWYYTTSPPVALDQIKNVNVTFGNLSLKCIPQAAVGPQATIQQLQSAGLTEGSSIPLFKNRGNVILVKKGNPKHIASVWDLARPDVRVITPHPTLEKDTFVNYSNTIFDVALNDEPNVPRGWTAERLFNSIFNNDVVKDKWLIGARIHHRESPWSVAYGRADATVIFYHLALDAVRSFPDLFEIVPIGGTADNPQPLPGNRLGPHFVIRIKGNWTPDQLDAREKLINAFGSSEFTGILERHGMTR